MKKKFCKGFLALTFTLLCLKIPAQQALKIGETLPESFWTTPLQVVNHPEKTITLDKDRGKLILLDFWNTWCSACLKAFPKMEALQKDLGDQVRILAVTSHDRPTLEKFFATKNGQRFKNIVSVTAEPALAKYFPHKGVPFIVWVKDGKLLNTTDGEQVTAQNIRKVLQGNGSLQQVVQMDRSRPLFLSEAFDRQQQLTLQSYSIFARGAVPDIGGGGTFRYTATQKVKGQQFTNLPLFDMYFSLGYHLFQQHGVREAFSEKRMVLNVRNMELLKGKLAADDLYDGDSLYNYELIVPDDQAEHLYTYMLQDLNRYAPFEIKIEKRPVKCLVLKRTTTQDRMATKGGPSRSTFPRSPSVLQNAPLKNMVNMLNGNTPVDLPVIDETGYSGNVDLQVSAVTTTDNLRKELKPYGLDLVEEIRPLEMMIITERSGTKSSPAVSDSIPKN